MWRRDAEEFYKMEEDRRNREKQVNMAHSQMLQL
jgi:hypothetical protein